MFINRRQVTIEWGDCDPAGIVYYPQYFSMFNNSTVHLFQAALGIKKREMLLRYGILGIAVTDTRANFRIPSRFGDVVTIESSITKFNRSSFDVTHQLLRDDGALAIKATETRVWVVADPHDYDRIKAQAIPADVIEALSIPNPHILKVAES